jgi:putative flippase GtrA
VNVLQNSSRRFAWTRKMIAHIPPGQFLRYLIVGGWNTLFSYASFAVLTALLTPLIPKAYIVASALASLINITVSYLGYKWFVFKTRGNYVREWLRAVAVYSTAILISIATLPVLVFLIRRLSHLDKSAPYLAGALLTAFSVIYSFLGHKRFSFGIEGNPQKTRQFHSK